MNVLLLNQCFYPDVMATAQQLADLAQGLVREGHNVTVIANDRGYDNPSIRFPRRETWNGIKIIRIPSVALGKGAKWRRALSFASFLTQCAIRLLFQPRFDAVVALTAPPLISVLATLFLQLKGGRLFLWIMDLNPDQAIAAGWLSESSLPARGLAMLLRYSLGHADMIIVLDRFMKRRLLAKGIPDERISVMPPWTLDEVIAYDPKGREAFRERNNLSESFVVMYSGNHSPCHPLDTLLAAAKKLADRSDIVFCFVGGGSEFSKVERYASEHGLTSVRCLRYQRLEDLSASLSAADLHVVVMGDPFTGIIHPCKVYNILRIGTPFLYVGPEQGHIVDILAQVGSGCFAYEARHGDVESVVEHILAASQTGRYSGVNKLPLAKNYSRAALLPPLIELLESGTVSQISDFYEPPALTRKLG
jgi:colanic acid biosynthesis glycosyl transferase WcaI